ncbi:TIGR00730 family Rossman fold protein [Endomicrobium proavitum]|uniref:Cytokinin riboside 5'-monophosphate phosphoribohydrolase n=1 Tax=Endomicrobium proavitum TaxID=1408281 RepID=A0A0G3WGA7_9BACT|nr:TIGR00730 family Rossman fold protein [Endomicrobium proavitum]AKL97686.1 hypothetical protein Epro_0307 [Endomicrobium proavitum]
MSETAAVFCGSSEGKNPAFKAAAENLARIMAKENIELVYGGGNVGLMGVLASGVLKNGGRVTGVIPDFLKNLELAHTGLSELIISQSMHERKQKMYELADYFIVLPGGIGTIDEFAEVFTWSQLDLHKKPCALVNIAGYFDDLLKFFNNSVEETFLKKEHLNSVIIADSVETALEKCRAKAGIL